jgi:DNA-3-methyladenine glycosylase II
VAQISFRYRPRRPFRLDLTVWALRRRAENRVDRWDGRSYRRVLVLSGKPRELTVTQTGPDELHVVVTGARLGRTTQVPVSAALERMLGLAVNLNGFYRRGARDPVLTPLAMQFRGLKPPRFPTLFEALVNGMACQQVTLTLGITLLNRLAEAYGVPYSSGTETVHAFPRPEELAGRSPDALRKLGFSRQKGRAMIELAEAVAGGGADLEDWARLDDEPLLERLCGLRGVGRWTAEYALLRGLGRLHVFPGDDVGARRNLIRWLGLAEPLDYAGVHRALERWQPYAGFVYFHLLLKGLAESGYLTEHA